MHQSPLPNSTDSWSPRWRSLHPMLTDGEILDALKAELEKRLAAEGKPHAIVRLGLYKQGPPYFRLSNGELCHWAKVTKAASTSILRILCKHLPHLWFGAYKHYELPDGQDAASNLIIDGNNPLYPERITLPETSRWHKPLQTRELFRSGTPASPRRLIIRCNPTAPKVGPWNLHALVEEPFQPYPHTKIRFCIVRDPVERFLSTIAYIAPKRIRTNLPEQRRDLQEICEQMLTAMESEDRLRDVHLRRQIRRIGQEPSYGVHLNPQVFFLGRDPAYYTHIFRMGEWERLETCLSEWIGKSVRLPHINASRDKDKISLTPALQRRVEALYAEDDEFWGRYF